MCTTTSTNPIVGNLIGSPMFNLSLSSTELFHSNFLAWLGNNQGTKVFFEEVIKDLVNDPYLFPSKNWTVMREDKHFDLCIKDGKGKAKDNFHFGAFFKLFLIPDLKLVHIITCEKTFLSRLVIAYLKPTNF